MFETCDGDMVYKLFVRVLRVGELSRISPRTDLRAVPCHVLVRRLHAVH